MASSAHSIIKQDTMSSKSFCKECRGWCVYTISSLTCTQCGLEQGDHVFTDEFDVAERCAIYDPNDYQDISHPSEVRRRMMFDDLKVESRLPDAVITLAEDMYKAFEKKTKSAIKGEQRKREVACACLMYASRSMPSGAVTHDGLCMRIKNMTSFAWALKEVSWALAMEPGFNALIKERMTTIDDSTSKMLNYILEDFKDSTSHKKLRHVVLKLQDRIRGCPELHTHNPEKINATIIMMAVKYVKAPLTMKRIGMLTGTSEPTMLKMEKIIQSLMKSS